MLARERVAVVLVIILLIAIGTGTAFGAWSGATVREYALGALIAGVAGALIWGFRSRFERRGRASKKPTFSILMNGPVSVQEGTTYREMSFHVHAGDIVHGSLNERLDRPFDLTVRSRNATRHQKAGEPPPILFYHRGSSASLGIPASPVRDTYVFSFATLGDKSGREIVIYLVANSTSESPEDSSSHDP